jgi:4-hydroxy-tetrahydrodipicolinate reductase
MGVETVAAVCREDDLELAGAVCLRDRGGVLATPCGEVPLSTDLAALLDEVRPQVVVDFTNASACMEAAMTAGARSINLVLGSSGLSADHLAQLDALANDNNIGVIVAPNFALGAVVLKRLVEQAAPYFDYVDIVESHHEAKIDSPSGFSLALAGSIAEGREFKHNDPEKENLPGTRGGELNGVSIHSVRMPGRSAHHEVVFGAAGQTVTLRHDTLGRDCYMPGVVRCIREVVGRPGLVIGLENILGL